MQRVAHRRPSFRGRHCTLEQRRWRLPSRPRDQV